MEEMGTGLIVGVSLVGSITFMGSLVLLLKFIESFVVTRREHKERMAAIEKGMTPVIMDGESLRYMRNRGGNIEDQFMEEERKMKVHTYAWITIGPLGKYGGQYSKKNIVQSHPLWCAGCSGTSSF